MPTSFSQCQSASSHPSDAPLAPPVRAGEEEGESRQGKEREGRQEKEGEDK